MDPRDKETTAFTCHRGLYQFRVMPFGLCNAPDVFSDLMSKVLRGCEAYCMHYIDDILLFPDKLNPYLQHLQIVLNRILEHLWESQHPESFQLIKDSLTVVPLLVYPDPNKPYVLYTDGSDKCIGSCLVQEDDDGEEKPIYFLSHKLSDSQVRWSTIEKEAFAIFYSLLHFYLCNAQFTIKTYHMPLIYLLKSLSANKKIQIGRSTFRLMIALLNISRERRM